MTSRVNGDGFLDVVATVGTVIATSIASLLPLLIFWRHFLFFFHDDWLMLDRLDRLGVGRIAWLFAPHHQLDAAATLRYASEYLILNPLSYLLPFLRVKFEGGNLLIFGLIKIAVFVWAFRKSAPSARPLLWTLVALDLLLAASLGYARWQTGLPTTTSSRYQYIPLLCFGPMVGILLARLRPGSQIAIAFLCIVLLTLPWKRHIEQWSTARGKTIRTAIAQDDPEQSFDPSFTTAGRARELARRYGLH